MKKYILLGSNNPNPSKKNLKVISSSNDSEKLIDIWDTINKFYDEVGEIYTGSLPRIAEEMVKKNPYLDKLIDIQLESIIWNVKVIGIFETIKVGRIPNDFLD